MATDNATAQTHDELDELWEQFLASEPLAKDSNEVMELEKQIQRDGQCRRAVLASMKFGGAELLKKSKDDEGAYVLALSAAAGDYWLGRTKKLVELIETQVIRLNMALCEREDAMELLKKAEAELSD